jgi:hypothetical protein
MRETERDGEDEGESIDEWRKRSEEDDSIKDAMQ